MNSSQRILDRYWLCFALLALAAVFCVLHPELVLFYKSPMSGDPWTIKDPTVSWMAFMPSLREFRFELFEHGNILWSNLRALGQPMLGNGVQAAPLFPLTLIFIGLPDTLFWSLMPIARVLLIALACFVLAHRVFGLPLVASFAFALFAGFNLNVLRWINHPWSNGILAGLWYLFFLYEVSFGQQRSLWSRRGVRLGLIITVYSMITCGFPEAAAVAALLVLFIFGALIVANIALVGGHWRVICRDLLLTHIAGFGFSALQLFALLEYINFTGAMTLRENYIGATFRPDEAQSYWLSQFTLLWESDLQHRYLNFSVGLMGFVLAVKGLVAWLICYRKESAAIYSLGVGFLLLMLLFAAKLFGLFAPLAWLFARTPVLAQSHFPLYFSPLFYFGAAFFAAIGVYSIYKDLFSHVWQRILDLLVTVAAAIGAIRLLELSVEHFNNISRQNFWIMQERGDGANFIWVFLGISGLLVLWQLLTLNSGVRRMAIGRSGLTSGLIVLLILAGVVVEMSGTQRNRYANTDSTSLFVPEDAKLAVEEALRDSPLARHELRNNDYSGRFVGQGIATIDNGISAMLPANTRRVRRALYHTQFGGYYPLGGERFKGAGGRLANNLQIVPPQPTEPLNWNRYQPSAQTNVEFLAWDRAIEQMRDNPLVLKGSLLTTEHAADTSIWIHLQGGERSLWVPAEMVAVEQAGKTNQSSTRLEWSANIATHWLQETNYQFLVRVVKQGTYQDSEKQTLVVHKPYPFAQASRTDAPAPQSDAPRWQVTFDVKALPRAFVASGCEVFDNEDLATEFLVRDSGIPQGRIALLKESTAAGMANLDIGFCDNYAGEFQAVRISQDYGSRLKLAELRGPALLYLGDTYYPGWRALDLNHNSSFNIQPANLGMRAVYLPEERDYLIEFSYRPAWLVWVYLLLLIACIATTYLLKTATVKTGSGTIAS